MALTRRHRVSCAARGHYELLLWRHTGTTCLSLHTLSNLAVPFLSMWRYIRGLMPLLKMVHPFLIPRDQGRWNLIEAYTMRAAITKRALRLRHRKRLQDFAIAAEFELFLQIFQLFHHLLLLECHLLLHESHLVVHLYLLPLLPSEQLILLFNFRKRLESSLILVVDKFLYASLLFLPMARRSDPLSFKIFELFFFQLFRAQFFGKHFQNQLISPLHFSFCVPGSDDFLLLRLLNLLLGNLGFPIQRFLPLL